MKDPCRRIAFVVNGGPDSPMGLRAKAFAVRLQSQFAIRLFYRSASRFRSVIHLTLELLKWRPRVCYVFDMAATGVLAAAMCKAMTRSRIVIDTGDAITVIAWSLGRGRIGRWLTAALERFSLAIANRIVVRGSYHREWLQSRGYDAEVVPDGVDMKEFRPQSVDELRDRLAAKSQLTIGIVGSSVWSERLQQCYGWDLVEAIRILQDRAVVGLMIGDGSGIEILQSRCREYGIADRIRFVGRLPHEDLPQYINAIDVCLSTQTNDLVGQVRTTGKLPLYLACGRFVLASNVGEAARVLPAEMLVEYEGSFDRSYPNRLVDRLQDLMRRKPPIPSHLKSVELADRYFNYDALATHVANILTSVAAAGPH